jgi:hypothetical protein
MRIEEVSIGDIIKSKHNNLIGYVSFIDFNNSIGIVYSQSYFRRFVNRSYVSAQPWLFRFWDLSEFSHVKTVLIEKLSAKN